MTSLTVEMVDHWQDDDDDSLSCWPGIRTSGESKVSPGEHSVIVEELLKLLLLLLKSKQAEAIKGVSNVRSPSHLCFGKVQRQLIHACFWCVLIV